MSDLHVGVIDKKRVVNEEKATHNQKIRSLAKNDVIVVGFRSRESKRDNDDLRLPQQQQQQQQQAMADDHQ